jgi:hypothetical protein
MLVHLGTVPSGLRRLGATAGVQISQLRLQVALQSDAVFALEGSKLLDPLFQRFLALFELRGDRVRALLGIGQ